MNTLILLLAATPALSGASEWAVWSPRPETAPRTFVDPVHSRSGSGALAVSGNGNPAVCGGWERREGSVVAGRWYRLTAYYRAEGLDYEPLQVLARLDWESAAGRRAGQPEYAWKVTPEGAWNRVVVEAPAPVDASAAKIQLFLLNAPRATVWWDAVKFEPVSAPAARPVRIAAINHRPAKMKSSAEAVDSFLGLVEKTVSGKTDVILLPEGITVVGTGKKYADVAETLPGPTTEKLGEMARRKSAYLVAGVYEREGATVYNTAVLIDRNGKLAGKYRKVYIPREEMEGGLTPGSDFPVFDTDFGRIGLMICYDVFYADPARALALRGAELVLMPIWGGNQTLGKARAIENHVFLATSGYDYPTYVMDPDGEILAEAREPGTAAITTIDLNRRYADKWLGEMRGRFLRELRGDVRVDPAGRR